jgi:hypothetical protein
MSERQTVAGAYQKIESHEDLCAERYANINTTLGELKEGQRSHAKAAWGVVLALVAWMAVQLWNGQGRPQTSAQTVVMSQPAAR